MLELRPVCEHCGAALPPESTLARICSFECTFCADCAETVLHNVCPNCGGGFVQRPIRPRADWKGGNFLGKHPPAAKPKHRPADLTAHEAFSAKLRGIPPERR